MNQAKTESHRRARPFLAAALIAAGGCQLISGASDLTFDDSSAGQGGEAGAGGIGGIGGMAGAPASGGGGSGGGPECEEASECPGVETTCAYRVCEGGVCGSATADAGAPCREEGGSFCDGMGACVECLTPEHCEAGFVCQAKSCVPLACTNQLLDPEESDVDCGGICPDCENGSSCDTFADCESAFCDDGTSGGGGTGGGGGGGGAGGGAGGGGGGGAPSGKYCAPCSAHDDCAAAPSSYCEAGVCLPREILGAPCADDAACLSGHCADGVCCDQACESGCVSCLGSQTGALNGSCDAVTAGTDPAGECLGQPPSSCGAAGQGCNGDPSAPGCILYDSATVCVAASCDPVSNEATLPAHCDGVGSCEPTAVESCFPYQCNAALTACTTQCNGDGDCDAGGYCEANLCLPKQAPGVSCTLAKHCQSGFCVDGVCCDAACGGTCRACSQAKTGQPSGTCAFIPDNQDPDNECFLSSCNGAGACAL